MISLPAHSADPFRAYVLSFLLKLRTRAQIRFRFSESHSMLVWAVIVGVAGAFATAAFRFGIDELQRLFGGDHGNFVEMATRLPWPVRVALPTAGGLIAGLCLLFARRRSWPFPDG